MSAQELQTLRATRAGARADDPVHPRPAAGVRGWIGSRDGRGCRSARLQRFVRVRDGTFHRAMNLHRRVLTDRLELRETDPSGDLEELFAIFNDPSGWWYDPVGRHTDRERTRDWLTRAAARFEPDGLSYWTVRRRDAAAVIGVGGAQRQRTRAWNLNYRLAMRQQGHGFATELGRAAYAAASEVDPAVPFIAWIAPHNTLSRKVAERLGLTNYGPCRQTARRTLRPVLAHQTGRPTEQHLNRCGPSKITSPDCSTPRGPRELESWSSRQRGGLGLARP